MNTIENVSCLVGLKSLPDNSIDCCVTSPPYFGLRDYGIIDQIGLEKTPEEFVAKMVEVFTEVKRVLKQEGTLWLNLGDSYATHGGSANSKHSHNFRSPEVAEKEGIYRKKPFGKQLGMKEKDLIGIPWMVAFALRSSGWYLRQDIIWHKPNPMPESVTDRCTKSHEYIFLLSKSQKYYYDAESIRTPGVTNEGRPHGVTRNRLYNYDSKENNNPEAYLKPKTKVPAGWDTKKGSHTSIHREGRSEAEYSEIELKDGANKRSVWIVPTAPYTDAHFATFPQDLIVDCVKAGCPEGGIVLDPFMGAATTAVVARKLNRNYIGFELNLEYIKIGNKRLYDELGMFL